MASDFPASIVQHYEDGSEVQEYTPGVTVDAFVPGSLIFFDTVTQLVKLCGADPALIAGISEVDSVKAALLTPNGKVPVRNLNSHAVAAMCSATTPAETNVGLIYGVVKLASGNWAVDTTDVPNARVMVMSVDIPKGIWFVKFLAANLQFDAIVS